VGGAGGSAGYTETIGGSGGAISATFSISNSDNISVYVGGGGGSDVYAGCGGGGSSAVVIGNISNNKFVMAGGGGGAGGGELGKMHGPVPSTSPFPPYGGGGGPGGSYATSSAGLGGLQCGGGGLNGDGRSLSKYDGISPIINGPNPGKGGLGGAGGIGKTQFMSLPDTINEYGSGGYGGGGGGTVRDRLPSNSTGGAGGGYSGGKGNSVAAGGDGGTCYARGMLSGGTTSTTFNRTTFASSISGSQITVPTNIGVSSFLEPRHGYVVLRFFSI